MARGIQAFRHVVVSGYICQRAFVAHGSTLSAIINARQFSGSVGNSSARQETAAWSQLLEWGLLGTAAASIAVLLAPSAVADAKTAVADSRTSQLKASVGTSKAAQVKQQVVQQHPQPPPSADKLPEYAADEVAQHRTPNDRVWVTYKNGVYDITDFIAQHPGGAAKIMLAAGGSVEPFWGLYQQHQKQEVQDIIKQYRIGTLKGAPAQSNISMEDPYKNEPKRHPALTIRSDKPFNGETPPDILAASLVTPAGVFYVRHHLPVPVIDQDKYSFKVEGQGLRTLQLSVPELQKHFRKFEVAATVQCAGNRRSQMKAQPAPGSTGHEIKGLDWEAGAIGTAVWGGVKLRDVLLAAGFTPGDPCVAHIHFYGYDVDESGTSYAASIPVAKAVSEYEDVLLAWEMNGQPIPRDHGGPLRVIVPGTTGARSVKWISMSCCKRPRTTAPMANGMMQRLLA
eukprot:GHRR01020172.1.p1 GENE.GHRR01020172.1~~GHRR01020172.1.p1  ORF type:complete len:455 (+),score=128.97 GHRR01020172.1:287-1651(+)